MKRVNRRFVRTTVGVILAVIFAGSVWVLAAPPQKVTICCNGHTKMVKESAVPAHLAHGDVLGPCR